MMNLVRLLSRNSISAVLAVSFFILSCEQQKEKKKFVAKVEDSLLTSEDILALSKIERNKYLVEGELVRNWIDSEVINKEAQSVGVYNSKEFLDLIETQKIKFAESILAKDYIDKNYEKPSIVELQSFYENSKDNFILQDDGYLINVISFSDEQTAILFRNMLIQNDWNYSFEKIKSSEYLKAAVENKFYFRNVFFNSQLLNLIDQMEEDEASIIVNAEPGDFKIVQVLKKYDKFSIPDFNHIQMLIEERYKIKRSQELYREYLNKLYEKYNVELKTEQ